MLSPLTKHAPPFRRHKVAAKVEPTHLEVNEQDFNLIRSELKRRGWEPAALLALRFLTNRANCQQELILALSDAWHTVQSQRDDASIMNSVWLSLPPSPPCLRTESRLALSAKSLALPSRDTTGCSTSSVSSTPRPMTMHAGENEPYANEPEPHWTI